MKKLVAAVSTILLFVNLPLKAEENGVVKELAQIYAIENTVEKLAANDALAERHGAKGTSETTSSTINSKWQVRVDTSAIDDSRTVIASLEANESVGTGFRAYTPTLVVRKQEGEFVVFVNTGDFLGSGGTKVTTRMDKNKAVTRTWGVSTDHKAAFHPVPSLMAKALIGTEIMTVRLTPYSDSPRTFSFDVRGFDEVYKRF